MTTLERTLAPSRALDALCTPSRPTPAAARLLLALLSRLANGAIEIETPDGVRRSFGPHADPRRSVAAMVRIHDWRVASDTLRRGDIGFAEGYIEGRWDTPDLVRLLEMLALNERALERAFHGRGLAQLALRVRHALRANTKEQAKRNIVAHYDLGNAFYRLWLDETMTYSSAWFGEDLTQPLAVAQEAKYHRLLDALALPPGAHILEIGCGWGGFAEIAARAGYRVTGLSLSDAQTGYARQRLASAGLADRVTLRVQDYRDERGRYDGIVSIEMIEAVGERWWPAYFGRLRDSLAPGGRACLQAITIAEDRFDRYRRGTDFIQQYIFPGGMLPSASRLVRAAEHAGFECAAATTFGADYAETLRRWLDAFDAHAGEVRALGFDERLVRCWRFYLAYCIAGFRAGSTDVGHYTFVRT